MADGLVAEEEAEAEAEAGRAVDEGRAAEDGTGSDEKEEASKVTSGMSTGIRASEGVSGVGLISRNDTPVLASELLESAAPLLPVHVPNASTERVSVAPDIRQGLRRAAITCGSANEAVIDGRKKKEEAEMSNTNTGRDNGRPYPAANTRA